MQKPTQSPSLATAPKQFMNVCRTAIIPILAAAIPFLGYPQQSGSINSGTLTAPVAIYKVSPTHPEDLYRKAIEGEAVVSIIVDIFGNATDPQVESASQPKFGEAAMKAASEWIFEPATKGGVPIEVRAKLPFVFEIAFEHKMNVEIGREVFVELSGPIIPSSELAEDPLPSYVPQFSKFYPKAFRSTGKSAAVNLQFVISPKGLVLNPRILSISAKGFEKAALMAISHMEYQPIIVDGEAVHVSMIRPIQVTE